MSQLQKNLIDLREKRKLTQEQFAAKIEIKRPRYAAYEEGRQTPPYDVLIRIAKFHAVTLDQLLTGNCDRLL